MPHPLVGQRPRAAVEGQLRVGVAGCLAYGQGLFAPTAPSAFGSISATSSLPAASSAARLPRGTAVSTMLSSLARAPHQEALRTRVTVPAAASSALTAKGPALTGSLVRAPSLKASAVPVTDFGYSGLNSERQSA